MRRLTKSLLPILAALLYTATASAYKITVEVNENSEGFQATDTLIVDVRVNSEGVEAFRWRFYAVQDPTLISPNESASHLNAIPNQDAGSLYLYPSGEAWYITNMAFGGNPWINQSVATLVFHVVSAIPFSTIIIGLNFDYGPYGDFWGEGGQRVTGIVVLTGLHMPEPTTTMLMGLGLLGILYAGRRQRRAR